MSSVCHQGERQHWRHIKKEQRRIRRSAPSLRLYARLSRLGSLAQLLRLPAEDGVETSWWKRPGFCRSTPNVTWNRLTTEGNLLRLRWLAENHWFFQASSEMKKKKHAILLLIISIIRRKGFITCFGKCLEIYVWKKHLQSNSNRFASVNNTTTNTRFANKERITHP